MSATTESVLETMPLRRLWYYVSQSRVVRDLGATPAQAGLYQTEKRSDSDGYAILLWDGVKRRDVVATPREIERAWKRRVEARRASRRARASRRNRERREARRKAKGS